MDAKTKMLFCKKHGNTIHAKRADGVYRCKKCSVESVREWRRRVKKRAVGYMGGKCVLCGYNKYVGAMVFHHVDNNKLFSIGEKGNTRSWEKLKEELNKCVLLCLNCHNEIHAGIAQLVERQTVNLRVGLGSSPPSSAHTYCIDCGSKIDRNALRCKKCNLYRRRKVKNRPPKELLIKEIREASYKAVGRKYGVSDNTIRKWLK